MFDEKGIFDHLRELNESLKDWERYQSIPLDELHTDRDKRNMVLHALLISIQSAIDIVNHIIAEKGFRKPSSYRETFETFYSLKFRLITRGGVYKWGKKKTNLVLTG